MSLVYLITSLPALETGKQPPITRAEFAAKARETLGGAALADLEQVLLLEEIDQTVLDRNRDMLGLPLNEDHHPLAETLLLRAVHADHHSRFLPLWVLKERPMHLMMRHWFSKAYKYARSPFLKRYCKMWLNLEEKLAGLLCKRENMSREDFQRHMEGGFDSTWRVMMQRYEDPDMGLGGRLRDFNAVREILDTDDLAQMEARLDEVRLLLIDRCEGTDPFDVDKVLGYYFRLRIHERQAARDRERGAAVLDEILNYQPEMEL